MYSLQRSPFLPKYFLSVGDWAVRLWNEELRPPVVVTPYRPAPLAAGGWSPTRPGVFFTADAAGCVEAWDLYGSQAEPCLQVHVCDLPLSSLRLAPGGGLVAAGAADGSVSLLKLSAGLVEAQPNEKQALSAVRVAV